MTEGIVDVTSGLYWFMVRAEPAVVSRRPLPASTAEGLRSQAQTLLEQFAVTRQRAGERLAATMDEVQRALAAMVQDLRAERPTQQELADHWAQLGRHYEVLLRHIRQRRLQVPAGVQLEHLKPRNLARNGFHVIMGVLSIGLYEFVLSRPQILALGAVVLGLFVGMEILRRYSARWNDRLYGKAFARISRPGEVYKICTATWYQTGLMIGVLLLPQHAIELGCLVLAFGDPVASLAGKRWGTKKIYADKSVVGTAAFFVVSALLCSAFIAWRIPSLALLPAVGIALAVAASGAIAELVSARINDNLSIPLVAGLVAALLL